MNAAHHHLVAADVLCAPGSLAWRDRGKVDDGTIEFRQRGQGTAAYVQRGVA